MLAMVQAILQLHALYKFVQDLVRVVRRAPRFAAFMATVLVGIFVLLIPQGWSVSDVVGLVESFTS